MDNQLESQSGSPARTHTSTLSPQHLFNGSELPHTRPIRMSQPFIMANLTLGLLNMAWSIIGLALMGQYGSYQIIILYRLLYLLFVRSRPCPATIPHFCRRSHFNAGNKDLTIVIIGESVYSLASCSIYYTCPPENQTLDMSRRKCGRASRLMPLRDCGGSYAILTSLSHRRGFTGRLYSGF